MAEDIAACERIVTATFSQFRQVAPVSGAAPTRATLLRIADDGTTLFIDIAADDPAPGQVVARQMRRDSEAMLAEDHVAIVIDARGERRDGLFFAVNANGAQYDGLIYDGGSLRSDWDALWQSEARLGAGGWTASLRIPLAVLGQERSADWRINAERWMPRGSERVRLAGWRADLPVQALGEGVEVKPTGQQCRGNATRLKASLRASHVRHDGGQPHATNSTVAPGLEVFHETAGGLRAAAAFNIDFGEAEADDRQVVLDRFELFRDEKRAFFLEDAGRFSFGGLDESGVMPFYSRRIGLDADGRAQKLQVAGKLSGEGAGFEYGLLAARLDARTADADDADAGHTEVAVARVVRPLGQRHAAGAIATFGSPEGSDGQWLWGLDHHFRDTAWRGARTLETRAWMMRSQTPEGGAVAYGGAIDYPNLGPTLYASFDRVERGFAPALGYLDEDAVARVGGTVGWWHRSARGDNLTPGMDFFFRRQLGGDEHTRELNPELVFEGAAGDVLVLEAFHVTDELAEGYAPLPAVEIEPGRHTWTRASGELATSSARPLSVTLGAAAGDYRQGSSDAQWLWLGVHPHAAWSVEIGTERHHIRQPSGSGKVWLASLSMEYTPHTHLAFSTLVQWDSLSEQTGISTRAHWRQRERWELFLALDSLGRSQRTPWRTPEQFTGTLKLVVNFGT